MYMFKSYGHIKKRNKITDFLMILAWASPFDIADLFCLHGNIRPGNTTISLFFCALKLFFFYFFVFLVKISRLYSFI